MPRLRKKNSKATKPEIIRNNKSSKAKKPEIIRNNKSSETTKGGLELLLPKKSLKIPRKKMLSVNMKKIEALESHEGDSIFEFIPSKTGDSILEFILSKTSSSKIDEAEEEHYVTKKIDLHTKALKKLITTSFNFVRDYEFLIRSAKELLRLVDLYIKDTKPQPFNMSLRRYDPPRCKETYPVPPNVSAYICRLTKNDCASVYPDSSRIVQNKSAPIDIIEYSPGHYCLPLDIKENKIWLEFKMLDEGNSKSLLTFDEEERKRSINRLYPLVGVIGGFAVAAFNKACATIKKVEHNLHDVEYMECKYVKGTMDYLFYMTIEAIEEGNLGVYEAIVACNRVDGLKTLLKFVLTDRTPVGSKAMALSLFSCLRSLCKTLEDFSEIKAEGIHLIHYNTTGFTRGKACYEMILLGYFRRAVMRGIRRVFSLNLQLLFEPDCTRRSTPDDWSLPDPHNSGMVPRESDMPCRGYDHYNQNIIEGCE